ncbi:MAG TPA: hypothetical protein VFC21_03035 [Bryobacteraceae bacterium]|nr:hypothetical protein [Bryobacteraceae bacterium]
MTVRFVLMLIGPIVFPAGYSFGQTAVCDSEGPRRYSEGEKVKIMTDSPWAKTVHSGGATPVIIGASGTFPSSPGGDRDKGPPSSHSASFSPRAPALKGDVKNPLAFYGTVTVRWETAGPIRRLTDIALPDTFENHYVISVKGLPAGVLRPNGSLLPNASLSARNRQPKAAEFVALTADKSTLLLAFPVFDSPITDSDKTVVFTMNFTGITISAKFEPKKMTCRDRRKTRLSL